MCWSQCSVLLRTVYDLCPQDVLCPFSFDDMLSVRRPIDDISLSYADVISELAMVRDAVLAFTDSFSIADVLYVLFY